MSFFSYQTHVIRFIIVPPLSLTSLSRKPVAPPGFDESGVGVVVGSFDVFLNSTCLLLHKQDDMLLATRSVGEARMRTYSLLLSEITRSAKDNNDGVVLELQSPKMRNHSQRMAPRSSREGSLELGALPLAGLKSWWGWQATYEAGLWSMATNVELDWIIKRLRTNWRWLRSSGRSISEGAQRVRRG